MQRAGQTTLAQRLRTEGHIHLEWLERFGEDLLTTVRYLEEMGVNHRDIKPDNIGVAPLGREEKLHLVLFDFSLSLTPVDNIRAGTVPYLDPFLSLRKPARWDSQAERFAVAMTLYEMATGTLPRWGDGTSRPDLLSCEATLNTEFFDPHLRPALTEFFSRALRPDYRERFENTENMLAAWRALFKFETRVAVAGQPEVQPDNSALVASARLDTHLSFLGLTPRVVNALDRLNVVTVQELLQLPVRQIYHLCGVGNKTRRELADLVNRLKPLFPEFSSDATSITSGTSSSVSSETVPDILTLEELFTHVIQSESGPHQSKKTEYLSFYLGVHPRHPVSSVGVGPWLNQTEVAHHLGITPGRMGQIMPAIRKRWFKSPFLARVGNAMVDLLEANSGAMTLLEACDSLLSLYPSQVDDAHRLKLAGAVLRAVIENEAKTPSPRFLSCAPSDVLFLVASEEISQYLKKIGQLADSMAQIDPILSPSRVIEELRSIPAPTQIASLTDVRLARLATVASSTAALSSRMELYPRGMSALKALKLAQGAFFGAALLAPSGLTLSELQERVSGRYPMATPLPGRPGA